jgi:2-polyprenyl-3-methyl-5-hydroxy-6-metoxy-1,4-benzoquinol methylase
MRVTDSLGPGKFSSMQNMSYELIYYPESRFGGFTNIDGTVVFYSRVNALLHPSSVVIDIGCGRGAYGEDPVEYRRKLRILRGKCLKVIGIDIDARASDNPFIDEFHQIKSEGWPVDDKQADMCISDNVLEHVENPDQFFSETRRILKPGGHICMRTPNVLSYFGLMSRLVPNRQHTNVLGKVKDGVQAHDVFPTLYRCNTLRSVRKMFTKYGFEQYVYGYDAEPSYLSYSRVFYYLGVLHQRYAPEIFKVGIHAFGRKPVNNTGVATGEKQ